MASSAGLDIVRRQSKEKLGSLSDARRDSEETPPDRKLSNERRDNAFKSRTRFSDTGRGVGTHTRGSTLADPCVHPYEAV